MKRVPHAIFLYLLCALLTLSSCGTQTAEEDTSQATGTDYTTQETAATTSAAIDPTSLFSDRDLEGTYEESSAISIQLTSDSAVCDSSSVSISGSQITITDEGVYLLSGTLTDGQIVVDAGDTDKVQIVLCGADITSATSAAIYALAADKVFITLADGTENHLSNGGEYIAIDENNIDAVIFSKTDLTLNGTGSLTIQAQAGHGVVSKDELVVTQGSYTITAASHGLSGKDSIAIAGGSFHITSGKDGIHAENSDDTSMGFLYIADGTFTIAAQGDAVSASGALLIDGGTFDLTTGEGSASVTMSSDSSFGQMGGVPTEISAAEEDTISQKGIKAEGSFTINGGSYQQTAGLPPAADADLHPGSDPDFLCHQQALCKAAAGYDEGYQVHLQRRLLCAGRRIW